MSPAAKGAGKSGAKGAAKSPEKGPAASNDKAAEKAPATATATTKAKEAETKALQEILRNKIMLRGDKPRDRFTMILYAEPGFGKTWFGATAENCLMCFADPGSMTIDTMVELGVLEKRPHMIEPCTPGDLETVYEYGKVRGGEIEWDTIVIDHMTELQKIDLDMVATENGRSAPILPDYGVNTANMRKLFRKLAKGVQANIVFLAEVRSEKDEQTGAISNFPALTPALATDMNGYVDVIAFGFARTDPVHEGDEACVDGLYRYLLTSPVNNYVAKDRSGALAQNELIGPGGFEALRRKVLRLPEQEEEAKPVENPASGD